MHLGWFVGHGWGLPSWRDSWSCADPSNWMDPKMYIEMATALERACFDYLIFEDALTVPDTYGGNMAADLRHGIESPRLDPTALVAILSQHTSHIGLIPTVSTSFYPPFMAARTGVTLDHLSHGRAGLNVVTSSSHRAAQNFGYDQHFEHDLRYEMADEWLTLVDELWNSWDDDAVIMDHETATFADHTKVRTIDFEGRFYRSRGPLNAPPGPQRRPVICQAGGSPAGREFAAKHADTILCVPLGLEAMKAYREDISCRMIRHGRDPKDCKVLYLVTPVLADTIDEARAKDARLREAARQPDAVEYQLSVMSYFSGIDFSRFDLDLPMPDLTGQVNGHQSSMSRYAKDSEDGKSLRELASTHGLVRSIELVGTPDSVAAEMGEAMEEVGGDGFLIASSVSRKAFVEIADGLGSALKRRGLLRASYSGRTFRENLLDDG